MTDGESFSTPRRSFERVTGPVGMIRKTSTFRAAPLLVSALYAILIPRGRGLGAPDAARRHSYVSDNQVIVYAAARRHLTVEIVTVPLLKPPACRSQECSPRNDVRLLAVYFIFATQPTSTCLCTRVLERLTTFPSLWAPGLASLGPGHRSATLLVHARFERARSRSFARFRLYLKIGLQSLPESQRLHRRGFVRHTDHPIRSLAASISLARSRRRAPLDNDVGGVSSEGTDRVDRPARIHQSFADSRNRVVRRARPSPFRPPHGAIAQTPPRSSMRWSGERGRLVSGPYGEMPRL